MSRVLIADSLEEFLREEQLPPGLETELYSGAAPPAGDFVGLIPDITRPVTAADLERLPELRIIANYGAGYDNIDLEAARARGVVVTNTPNVLTDATAELTWALMLAVSRRLGEGERLLRTGGWEGWQPTHMRGTGLSGKTLGIVGAGRIGQEVGQRALAFGMRVIYTSRSREEDWERQIRARRVQLDELLANADVITLHVPLTDETRHLIGERELRLMKPSAILVNTSRGPVVDEAALVSALEEGVLRGAGLDVYEDEPDVPVKLVRMENVVLLPHIGSATEEARLAMWQTSWRNLLAGVRGEPPPNPVT
jgi:glyoxylate reductase